MSGRGGSDRSRRDYPSRPDEKSRSSRSNAPPSRHLWVGNLTPGVSERRLADHFLRFGKLESVAFQPGRSYAFINFVHEEAAYEAYDVLQGFVVDGNPLRIEFAKAEKSATPSHDEEYSQRREEHHPAARGTPLSHRDSRGRQCSPDPYAADNSKVNDKGTEPSEVLWIGFPASMRVDEHILERAFAPFGEIEKITAFPGRTYAFVRFKNIAAAYRAKETLQGKLFGNPRVHICFAKSESGSTNSGKNLTKGPPSPHNRPYGRQGSSEIFHEDRLPVIYPGDSTLRSPHYLPHLDSRNPDTVGFDRKGNLWVDEGVPFEPRRVEDNMYRQLSSPRDRGTRQFHDFAPQPFPRQGPFYDDEWDLPEDPLLYRGAKKMKTSPFPIETELPEYPFSDSEQVRHVLPRMLDLPQHEATLDNRSFVSGHLGYNNINKKQITDPKTNFTQPYAEIMDPRNASYETFQASSVSFPPYPVDWKRSTPELHQPPAGELWKWEGTIAKGGTPVCRARCFPVGKVLDMMLPEYLDCTARTGLDMLAKHYYQAAGAWVVFFVPESDADMGFYNEFMNYLEEKQRAAVAKLDDKNTLFLVPPSTFSEKVLKVPGRLSISGVVLRLEQSASSFGHDRVDSSYTSFHGEVQAPNAASLYPKQTASPLPCSQVRPFSDIGKPQVTTSIPENFPGTAPTLTLTAPAHTNSTMPDSELIFQQPGPPAPPGFPHHIQSLNPDGRNIPSEAPTRVVDPMVQAYNSVVPRSMPETSLMNYTPVGNMSHQEAKPLPTSTHLALQPDQLAQLASALLGQQPANHPDNTYRASQTFPLPNNNQVSSELLSSQYGQAQQYQQQHSSSLPVAPPREFSTGVQGSQPMQPVESRPMQGLPVSSQPVQAQATQSQPVQGQPMQGQATQGSNTQEEQDADPQKRLQATLQLAAALLQQIQQGKGN